MTARRHDRRAPASAVWAPRLAAVIAALVLAAPAAAAGPLAPGALDRTFAGDGTLRSPIGGDAADGVDLVLARGERIVVLTARNSVVRLRATGGVDRRFGRRGLARLRDTAAVSSMARARDGALFVAGLQHGAAVAVNRLLSDGRRDVGFGDRGAVVTEINDVVVTEDVVAQPDGTALVVALVRPAPFHPDDHRVIVQRYDSEGLVGGSATINLDAFAFSLGTVRLLDGRLRYALDKAGRLVLGGLTADGRPDTTLGPRGLRDVGAARGAFDVRVTPSGRVLIAGMPGRRRVEVRAFTAGGDADGGFSDDGVAAVRLPFGAYPGALAVRANGGVAIAVNRRLPPQRPAALLLRPDGSRVRSFGRRGIAHVTGYPRRRMTGMLSATVDRLDRLVLGGFSGDGLFQEREDFARDFLAVARLRLHRPPLTLPTRARVNPSGVLRIPVNCRAAMRCMARLTVSRGKLRRQARLRLRGGGHRVVRIRLGDAGTRLRTVRLAARVRTPGTRTEPLAVRLRLRR
jgi:hypothetical protein